MRKLAITSKTISFVISAGVGSGNQAEQATANDGDRRRLSVDQGLTGPSSTGRRRLKSHGATEADRRPSSDFGPESNRLLSPCPPPTADAWTFIRTARGNCRDHRNDVIQNYLRVYFRTTHVSFCFHVWWSTFTQSPLWMFVVKRRLGRRVQFAR